MSDESDNATPGGSTPLNVVNLHPDNLWIDLIGDDQYWERDREIRGGGGGLVTYIPNCRSDNITIIVKRPGGRIVGKAGKNAGHGCLEKIELLRATGGVRMYCDTGRCGGMPTDE